jgi:RHS repeat-associated protein
MNLISVGGYRVAADLNLDGKANAADLSSFSWGSMGWGTLSLVGNRFGYAGYHHAPELAGTKWEARNRWLDSVTGVWNRRDPLGYVDGMSLYQYVRGMAIVGVDPMGLAAACICCSLAQDGPSRGAAGTCGGSSGVTAVTAVSFDCHADCDTQFPIGPNDPWSSLDNASCKRGCACSNTVTCFVCCDNGYGNDPSTIDPVCLAQCQRHNGAGNSPDPRCGSFLQTCVDSCRTMAAGCRFGTGFQTGCAAVGGGATVAALCGKGAVALCGTIGGVVVGIVGGGVLVWNHRCDACEGECISKCNHNFRVCSQSYQRPQAYDRSSPGCDWSNPWPV